MQEETGAAVVPRPHRAPGETAEPELTGVFFRRRPTGRTPGPLIPAAARVTLDVPSADRSVTAAPRSSAATQPPHHATLNPTFAPPSSETVMSAPQRDAALRVLVVDDHPDAADSMRLLLEVCGYTALAASD